MCLLKGSIFLQVGPHKLDPHLIRCPDSSSFCCPIVSNEKDLKRNRQKKFRFQGKPNPSLFFTHKKFSTLKSQKNTWRCIYNWCMYLEGALYIYKISMDTKPILKNQRRPYTYLKIDVRPLSLLRSRQREASPSYTPHDLHMFNV